MLPFLGAPGAGTLPASARPQALELDMIWLTLSAAKTDDDGSGTTSLLQAFRVLVDHSFTPSHNPVELQFFSAEEGGLLGSQAVAQSYAKEGKKVRAMLQCDMSAVVKPGTKPTIGLIRDFVDPEWTEHLALIIDEYSEIGFSDTQCGYVSCSLLPNLSDGR
jgi:bacterial leucyl aminopeptidase